MYPWSSIFSSGKMHKIYKNEGGGRKGVKLSKGLKRLGDEVIQGCRVQHIFSRLDTCLVFCLELPGGWKACYE